MRNLVHYTDKRIDSIKPHPPSRGPRNDKPSGFWYSYGTIWRNFCNMNKSRVSDIDLKWIYTFSLPDDCFTYNIHTPSKESILMIDKNNYKEFITYYMTMSSSPPLLTNTKWYNFWELVKQDWGGVEFCDSSIFSVSYIIIYAETRKKAYKVSLKNLLGTLDIVSGCIFNPVEFRGGLSLNEFDLSVCNTDAPISIIVNRPTKSPSSVSESGFEDIVVLPETDTFYSMEDYMFSKAPKPRRRRTKFKTIKTTRRLSK